MTKTDSKKCAICSNPEQEKFKPFCSARCAQIDLGKWLGGSYVVQTNEDPDYADSDTGPC